MTCCELSKPVRAAKGDRPTSFSKQQDSQQNGPSAVGRLIKRVVSSKNTSNMEKSHEFYAFLCFQCSQPGAGCQVPGVFVSPAYHPRLKSSFTSVRLIRKMLCQARRGLVHYEQRFSFSIFPGSRGICSGGLLIWKSSESTHFLTENLCFVSEIICELYDGQQFTLIDNLSKCVCQ